MYNVHLRSPPVKMYSVLMAYPAKTDRDRILAVALEQVEREGVESLAIRGVAAKLELAPNALYRYFNSLAALEAAVAEEARLQVLEAMQKVIGRKGPTETIRAISEAYIRFAQQRPRIFALYLKTYGTEVHTPQCLRNTEFFLEHVTRLYGEKLAWEAAHALWAFLHGAAVLLDAGVVPAEKALTSLQFGLQLWINGAHKSSKGKFV